MVGAGVELLGVRMKKIWLLVFIWPMVVSAKDFFGIENYKPQAFSEQATSSFFYSIGNQLKFGNSIDINAPSLFKDASFFENSSFINVRSISNGLSVFSSPDGKKAAVFSSGNLYIAEVGKPTRLILEGVDYNDAKKFRAGEIFYKLGMLQWDSQSKYIYIAKDKKQNTLFEQSFSVDATLIRVDISKSTAIADIIPDFRSIKYFLVNDGGVCFNYGFDNGNVNWRCLINGNIQTVNETNNGVVLQDGTRLTTNSIFVSSFGGDGDIWLTNYGYSLKPMGNQRIGFYSQLNERPLFTIKGGTNIKGHFVDGVVDHRSAVLPGGRYVVLYVWHDNFKGQLLVDGLTGQYKELPRNTWIYQSLNSANYENVKFDLIKDRWPMFFPVQKLRE